MGRYATVVQLRRIRNFLREIDRPITQTDLANATGTGDTISSAIKFMLKEGWIKRTRDNATKLYYLADGEWAKSIWNTDNC